MQSTVLGGLLSYASYAQFQHYVEVVAERHHLVVDSVSDLFTTAGRTNILVMWELSVRKRDERTCEFTNHVRSRATEHFLDFLARQGIRFEVFVAQRVPMSAAHNRQETPFFAASIGRHALRNASLEAVRATA